MAALCEHVLINLQEEKETSHWIKSAKGMDFHWSKGYRLINQEKSKKKKKRLSIQIPFAINKICLQIIMEIIYFAYIL